MTFKTIVTKKEGSLRTITLNRPDAANSMNLDFAREFYDIICEYSSDSMVRAILINANGKMFCGGGDLAYLSKNKHKVKEILLKMTNYLHGAIARMSKMRAPIVIAVQGSAGGGGVSLAISGDLVFSAVSAKFTLAYTNAGLSPDASSTFYLPRLIGMRKAKELMLTNRVITANEALNIGMIDRVYENDVLQDEARQQAEKFASGPTSAYGSVKKLLNLSFSNNLESQMDEEGLLIAENASTDDGLEGVQAFLEKRKPIFKG